jgi:hypothetical protein
MPPRNRRSRPGSRLPRGLDDGLHIEVALAGGGWPDVDGLVGEAYVEGFLVGVRVDGDGGYPQLPASPDDTKRDLAAVRDQYFVQHSASTPIQIS